MKIFKTFRFICVTVLLMIGTEASAYDFSVYDFSVDGIYYNISSDSTCSVTSGSYTGYTGDVTIPEKVTYNNNTLTVTAIHDMAFYNCRGLKSVTIPNSVTKIGYRVFEDCAYLTSITIPNSVITIGSGAFCNCSRLTSITIPNSVTTIGSGAFCNCSRLTSITIPNSMTTIGNNAFSGCSELKKLIIEDGTETLDLGYEEKGTYNKKGKGIFYDCPLTSLYLGRNLSYYYSPFSDNYYLTEVTIGNTVTEIGEYLFEECTNLKSITIPNSVTTIGAGAFKGCYYLKSITIPNSMTTIGNNAFKECYYLTQLYSLNPTPPTIEEYTFTYEQYKNINVFVPQGSLSAYQSAYKWHSFKKLQEFVDPTGVETIKADMEKIDGTYHDIQGRKLDAPKNGLNIINGKKVLIRK